MLDFYYSKEAEDIPVEYDADEQNIEKLLHNRAVANTEEGVQKLDQGLGGKVVRSMESLYGGLALMNEVCSNVQDGDVDLAYSSYVNEAIYRGSLKSGWGLNINSAMHKEQVREGIVKVSGYYTNKFFNEIVIPKVQNAAEKAIQKGGTSREVYDEVRKSIDDHYKNVRYWRLVANNSASRAFHYGLCKGGAYQGYKRVRYNAVMDSRTSAICRQLNGTEWDINTIVDTLERATTGSVTDWEQYTPWMKADEYDGMTNAEMEEAGVIIPPRHPFCRSVLQLL